MMLTVCCCLKMKQVLGPVMLQKRHNSLFNRSVHFFCKKNLFLINTVSSGGCMGIGDLIQQEYEYRAKILSERYNWDRAGNSNIRYCNPGHRSFSFQTG